MTTLMRALLPGLGRCLRRISREGKQLGIAAYSQDIVQQRLTHAEDTLRPIHQFPQRSAGDVAVQHVPEMKHEGNPDQVGQLKASGRIVLTQRSYVSAGDPFAIVVSETLSERGTQIAAAP